MQMRFTDIEHYLGRFRVGIAGAGGLGSNCAVALARCGIGTIVISDFDVVEKSNLSRQFYFTDQIGMMKTAALKENLLRIRPDIVVIALKEKLNRENIPSIFEGCNVIVEAFDKAEMKEMLIETVQKYLPGIPLVVGSGIAGWGGNNKIRFRKIDDTLYLCGDETTEASDELPVMAPRVCIVASMQANAVIEILMNKI